MRLDDQAARDRIRNDLDTTLIVEAASGTGKTSELVRRMVATLMAGRAQLDRMVAVTFTEPAAGELKLRLRGEIETARQDPECSAAGRALLTAALPQLEEARIGTIHSFCADLLRERPVQAGVDPLFEVAPDDVAGPLFDRAFERWFEAQLAAPGEAVRRILRRRTRRGMGQAREEGPRELLRRAARDLVERRDFPRPWRRDEGFDREGQIDELMEEISALGAEEMEADPNDYFTKSLTLIARFGSDILRREAVRGRDYDGLEAELTELSRARHWRWRGSRWTPDRSRRDELRERRDLLHGRLAAFVAAAGGDLAPRLRDELWPVVEGYESLKARSGCLDFLDLLVRARDVVRGDPSVRVALQRRFTHIYVDEFQDTDPLQAEILLLLAADDPAESDWRRVRPVSGKLFLVGDPKQSIYRFRRADVTLYETIKRQLVGSGAALIDLNVSFRAVPEIQQAVNAAFAALMRGERTSQPRYVPLAPWRPGAPGQPAVVALPAPVLYGDYGTVVNWKIEESLPDAVAAFVEWLVDSSQWTVTERERPGTRIPVKPRHVCLLFRRFRSFTTDVTRPYVRALEARRLPHLLVGGSSFHAREEVEAIRNALGAIERPEDDLAVFATLRGPFFALGDGALLAYRERCSTLHPFKEVSGELPAPLREVADALGVLRDLHRGRNHRPFADTIGRLLDATRAHAGLANWPTGEQALANVNRLMDIARRAERHGTRSFRGFLEQLAEQAERGEASDAPIVEEGTEGVRIMTVHRAKGLEFPVVILADMTAKETQAEPSRWVDPELELCAARLAGCAPPELREHAAEEMEREREEAARILYVAATRARDLLVVTAVGDGRHEGGWLSALDPAIYPHPARCREPESPHPAGCPTFGSESVVPRSSEASLVEGSVRPGLHLPETGMHRVVWWDPSALELGVEESVGLRQQKILEADESGARSEQGIRAHAEWQARRTLVRDRARAPSLRVVTTTELAASSVTAASVRLTPGASLDAGRDNRPPPGGERTGLGPQEQPPPVGSVRSKGPSPAAGPSRTEVSPTDPRSGASWPGAAGSVAVESAGEFVSRPHGKRFGTLVHAVLAVVPFDADRKAVEKVAALQGRLLGATSEEVTAATETASRALAHPLLRRAAAAARLGICRRETPVTLQIEDGTLVEGVIDAAFQEPGIGWTVIDFKTDLEISGRIEEYRRQVALYVQAVEKATGSAVRAVILQV